MHKNSNKTALVLLAAGASLRMGQPKQLLPLEDKFLIQIVVERLLACKQFPTVVVLGANYGSIAPALNYTDLNVIQNPNWTTGISSSIRCAVAFLEIYYPDLDRILFALVDQPFIEAEHYNALLLEAEQHPGLIIAAQYDDTLGAPMIFPKSFFPLLHRLNGDEGAGKIVRKMPENARAFPLPSASINWNIPTDLPPKHKLEND